VREWLVRNRYSLAIIGLAFYYTGFAIVGLVVWPPALFVILQSVPLLAGLMNPGRRLVIFGAALTFHASMFYNIPFYTFDYFRGFGWVLAGNYIAFSAFLFILTMVAWFKSS
jgi:hypothetical protein